MAKAQEQKNLFTDIRDWGVNLYRETVGELRKVVWPTLPEARNLTIIVLIVIFSMSILLGGFDQLFTFLFSLLFSTPA